MKSFKKALLPALVSLILAGPAMGLVATPSDPTDAEASAQADATVAAATITAAVASDEMMEANVQTAVDEQISGATSDYELQMATNGLVGGVLDAEIPAGSEATKEEMITATATKTVEALVSDTDNLEIAVDSMMSTAVGKGDAEDIRTLVSATVSSTATNSTGNNAAKEATVGKVVEATMNQLGKASDAKLEAAVKGLMDASAVSNRVDAETMVTNAMAKVPAAKKALVAKAALTETKSVKKEAATKIAENAIKSIGGGDAGGLNTVVDAMIGRGDLDKGQFAQLEKSIDALETQLTPAEFAALKLKLAAAKAKAKA